MKQEKITTLKMPGETEKEYTAWLFYCGTGSIDKLLRAWKGVDQTLTETRPELVGIVGRLGEPPSRTTIVEWSKKFHWVKRTDLKLTRDSEILQEEIEKRRREEAEKLTEAFRNLKKIIK